MPPPRIAWFLHGGPLSTGSNRCRRFASVLVVFLCLIHRNPRFGVAGSPFPLLLWKGPFPVVPTFPHVPHVSDGRCKSFLIVKLYFFRLSSIPPFFFFFLLLEFLFFFISTRQSLLLTRPMFPFLPLCFSVHFLTPPSHFIEGHEGSGTSYLVFFSYCTLPPP